MVSVLPGSTLRAPDWAGQHHKQLGMSARDPAFQGGLREEDAIISHNPHCLATDGPEACDERAPIQLLKFIKA